MNTKNLKALTENELKFLNQNYIFKLSDDKKNILLSYTNFPSKTTIWKIEGATSLAFSYKDTFTTRKRFLITEKAKNIFLEHDGKWNLLYIQNMLTEFMLNKRNINEISDEEMSKAYELIDFRQFILKG